MAISASVLLFVAFVSLVNIPTYSQAYPYSANFISQVTSYPNSVTSKSRCMPGRSGGSGASSQNVLICDPYELLCADQCKFLITVYIRLTCLSLCL